MSGERYVAPLLSRAEISICLSDLGLSVSEADLAKPTAELVKPIYEHFVAVLTGYTPSAQSSAFSATAAMEFPELHESSIPFAEFTSALNKLMTVVGVYDFSMVDILRPDAKRTRDNLSAIINFAKFREMSLGKYQEITQQTDTLMEKKDAVELENAELTAMLRKLKAQLEKDEPACEILRKEEAAKREEVAQLNNAQAVLQDNIRAAKTEAQELQDKANNDQFMVLSLKQDIQRLRSQIVQSPEKIKKSISQLNERIDDEKKAISTVEHTTIDLKTKSDALARVDKEFTKVLSNISNTSNAKGEQRTLKLKIRETDEEISGTEKKVREFGTNEHLMQLQITNAEERLTRLAKQYNLKINAAENSLATARAEYEQVSKAAAAAAEQVAKEGASIAKLRKQIEESKRQHKDELERVASQLTDLEKNLQNYSQNIITTLETA